jgi:ABC-type branched-subunit amino acid transport system substrate-binding protein
MRIHFRTVAAVLGAVLATSAVASVASAESTRGGGGKAATILLGVVGPFTDPSTGTETPEWPAAAKARIKAINKAGGIGGQKVKAFVCDTSLDPNKTEQCARDAAEAGVVANVAFAGTTAANLMPILEENGIASIGTIPVDPAGTTSPVSFPLTAGVPGAFEGLPILLGKEGATEQALVMTDLGAASAAAELFVKDSVERQGYSLGESIRFPPDQTDFAPIAATAAGDDPQGINMFIIGEAAAKFVQELRQSGYEGPISSGSPFLTEQVLNALGDNANGIRVVSLLSWQRGKNAKLFNRDMKKYAKGMALTDTSANYWFSTWVFEQVANRVMEEGGTIDAASILAEMGTLEDFDTGGMTPPITTTESPAIDSPFPLERFYNPTMVPFVIKNQKLKQTGPPFNPFEKQ